MKEIIAIIIASTCIVYGLRQMFLGRPAFGLDYWIVVLGIILSLILLQ
jgi:TM2 domain-containing membrane protein YozV